MESAWRPPPFARNGPLDVVKVDAYLSKDSTLDPEAFYIQANARACTSDFHSRAVTWLSPCTVET